MLARIREMRCAKLTEDTLAKVLEEDDTLATETTGY